MKKYSQLDTWKKMQYFFPEHLRITRTNYPKEEVWKRKNMAVHIDRYVPKKNTKDVKVILIHGGGANGRAMSPFAVPLVKIGYECIAPDLLGFGLTQYQQNFEYQDWINLLVNLLDKEFKKDQKPFVLIGASMGGMLAYQVACLASNIKGIVATSFIDTTNPKNQKVIARSEAFSIIGNQVMNNFSGIVDAIKVPLKELTDMNKMANNEDYVYLIKKDKTLSGSWIPLKWVRTMQNTKYAIEPEYFDKCPILLCHPEKDKLIDLEISKSFYDQLICEKELVILENCGHIPLEEPGISTMQHSVIQFLQKITN